VIIGLILKCAPPLRRLWRWPHDNYDVLEEGVVVRRILQGAGCA
jgi:hypothetical protein